MSTLLPPASPVEPLYSGASALAVSRITWPPATPMERARLSDSALPSFDSEACTARSSNLTSLVITAGLAHEISPYAAGVIHAHLQDVECSVLVKHPHAGREAGHKPDPERIGIQRHRHAIARQRLADRGHAGLALDVRPDRGDRGPGIDGLARSILPGLLGLDGDGPVEIASLHTCMLRYGNSSRSTAGFSKSAAGV